ncbi:MAG TPA: hypothetical protein VIK14_05475, partial [Ignavibacteria bacterium]
MKKIIFTPLVPMLQRLCENKKITPSFTTGIAKPPRIRALAQITLKIFYVFTNSRGIGNKKENFSSFERPPS